MILNLPLFQWRPYDAVNFLSTNAKLKKIGEADAKAIIRYCRQLPAKQPSSEKPVTPDLFTGWKQKNGYYYYYIDYKLQKNKLLQLEDGIYYVNETGRRQYGWQTVGKREYYFQKNGTARQGWLKISGKWYYFHKKYAYMYKDRTVVTSTGKKYTFDSRGMCTNRI